MLRPVRRGEHIILLELGMLLHGQVVNANGARIHWETTKLLVATCWWSLRWR